MIRWLLGVWYARLRGIDIAILWPACKQQTPDLNHAKGAFAIHACRDRAWLWLGDDGIVKEIEKLT